MDEGPLKSPGFKSVYTVVVNALVPEVKVMVDRTAGGAGVLTTTYVVGKGLKSTGFVTTVLVYATVPLTWYDVLKAGPAELRTAELGAAELGVVPVLLHVWTFWLIQLNTLEPVRRFEAPFVTKQAAALTCANKPRAV